MHAMAGVMWVTRFFVVEDMTDRSLTRYQEARFITRSLERLHKHCTVVHVLVHTWSQPEEGTPWGKNSDIRTLRLDPLSPEFRKLKSFFKSFEHTKSRYDLVLSVYSSLMNDQQY